MKKQIRKNHALVIKDVFGVFHVRSTNAPDPTLVTAIDDEIYYFSEEGFDTVKEALDRANEELTNIKTEENPALYGPDGDEDED